jgi:DNA polymerase III delta subunit
MPDLASSRVHAVIGDSLRLRDEALAALLSQWRGPVKRVVEPDDLGRIVLDLDTPSLFEEPALWVVRSEARSLRRHAEQLQRLATPGEGGRLVLVMAAPDKPGKGTDTLGALLKALDKLGARHVVGAPDGKELLSWLLARLTAHAQGVDRPRQVAEALIAHLGNDTDGLLGAIDVLAIHAGAGQLTVAGVEAVVSGVGEQPIWEFTGAVLDGNAGKAIGLLHAGGGMDAQPTLSALVAELRKLIACTETADDGEALSWINARGRPNLYYARSRAKALGRTALLRLFTGALMAQRQLRQGGADLELIIETLVLHAQRIVRPSRR